MVESSFAGEISSRGPGTTGAHRQRDALALEGVEVHEGSGGKLRVSLREYGWFPERVDLDIDEPAEGGGDHGAVGGEGIGAEPEPEPEHGVEGDSDSDLTSLDSEDLDGPHS